MKIIFIIKNVMIDGVEYVHVPKGKLSNLDDERLQACLEVLTEMRYFNEKHKMMGLAWNAINALSPELAELDENAAYERIHNKGSKKFNEQYIDIKTKVNTTTSEGETERMGLSNWDLSTMLLKVISLLCILFISTVVYIYSDKSTPLPLLTKSIPSEQFDALDKAGINQIEVNTFKNECTASYIIDHQTFERKYNCDVEFKINITYYAEKDIDTSTWLISTYKTLDKNSGFYFSDVIVVINDTITSILSSHLQHDAKQRDKDIHHEKAKQSWEQAQSSNEP